MDILFLDIDGVLNTNESRRRPGADFSNVTGWHPPAIHALRHLTELVNCKFVISSDWRNFFTLEELGVFFQACSLPRPIGTTKTIKWPGSIEVARGQEIELWLNDPEFADDRKGTNWLVVDDREIDLLDNQWRLVQTDEDIGLTLEQAKFISKLFRNGQKARIEHAEEAKSQIIQGG